ncbi:putative amidohydrolase [Microbacterium sp. SLBN-154]|uniref:nitrilase-related carbon-nitrogen hydrolase n=1 Tax=Microbacterium sp. SLBN-154 TaxID=2768458 RepID=UPI00115312A1|nr:nitrilase-related carbon-nitrogen hydrolase [Microbacterium sp. SLBN-154]TQK18818.1 putative amidohydrolase [Microbacterium sp. SLBN-154]
MEHTDQGDPASRRVHAVALSPHIQFGDVDGNLARLSDALAEVSDDTDQLIVAPELATSGYVFADRAEARDLGMSRDDPRLASLSRVIGPRTVAVVGFCERHGDDLFNSAVVVTREGIQAVYAKSHLWSAESTIFRPGTSAGIVVDTEIGRVGVAICYDNEFPEVPRGLALAGADILALPVCWPLVPRPDGERAPEIVQAMAAARSSRLPTVIADRHGSERDVVWTGGTAVIDGDGWVVAEAGGASTETVLDITPGHKALGPWNDLFGDRRPDIYASPDPHTREGSS